MLKVAEKIGFAVINLLRRVGCATLFFVRMLWCSPQCLARPKLLITQMHSVGVLSFLIIAVSGLFVGMVLGLLGQYILVRFNAEEALGAMVGWALVRELGPVIAALLFAGRAGSALTAEIGLMKATEQLAALEMMAVNPMGRVMAPRFIAGLISLPALTAVFIAMGVWGGYLSGVVMFGIDEGSYWGQMQAGVDWSEDVVKGFIKSFVFAALVTLIAVFEGYDCEPTSEGVARATTRTVVYSSLAVLAFDFVLTALMIGEIV